MPVNRYTNAEKARVCADLALLGDDQAVCDKHGVKRETLAKWKQQAWFKDMLDTLQESHNRKLVAKAHRAMNQALDELHDRVELGDVRCVLKGEQVVSYREPVKARDLGAIVNVLATRSEKAVQLQQRQAETYQLADLRDSFRQFASSYRAKQITDSTSIDGVVEVTDNAMPSKTNGTSVQELEDSNQD